MKHHIVFLCNEYPPFSHGGIGVLDQTLARRLVSAGWQVSVLGLYPVKELVVEDDQGVRVIRLPVISRPGLVSLVNAHRLQKAIKALNCEQTIDLIESSELGFGLLPANLPGKKIIRMSGGHTFFSVTLGGKPRFWRHLVERRSFALADHFCAVSKYVGETTRELMKMGDRKITILPNPVDPNLFRPNPEIEPVRNTILFVGTLVEKKGVRQLIEAIPLIRAVVPDAKLVLIGRDTTDKNTGAPYSETLKHILPFEYKEVVEFLGVKPNYEVTNWLARADICAYPSHMEAQGIVVIEAMAAGKAVVASQLGPGPELIEDGVNGLLCDPYSPRSIAEKIISLLTNDVLRYQLGKNARVTAVERFSIDVIIEENIRFYSDII